MGPRRRRRGRHPPWHASVPVISRLQWGHDEGVVEGLASGAFRNRGRRTSSFNGATTKASWKGRPLRVARIKRSDASMGPRRRRRGRLEAASTADSLRSFNGATTKASWKDELASRALASKVTLQWGHDEGVVEGVPSARCRCRSRMLQWGHDEGVVEGQTTGRSLTATSFNGATTKASWKAVTACYRCDGCELQWGHDEGVVEG